jgi:integrase
MPKRGKNIYRRKDGRWEGRFIKGRHQSGKIIYGSVYGKTCTEVKQRLTMSADPKPVLEFTVAFAENNMAFADVALQWLSITALKVKPSTYAGYTNTLFLHILPSLGNLEMQNLTAFDLCCFTKEKLERGRSDGKGMLSVKTVRDILSIVKCVVDFAWKEKFIPNQITVTYPKNKQTDIRVLSRQEQSTLEIALTTDLNIYKLGMLLCLYTGIRIGELCALRWLDISSEYDMLSIRHTLQRVKNFDDGGGKTKILIDTPKSSRSLRTVPIPRFLSQHIRRFSQKGNAFFLATDTSLFVEPRTMQNHFARIIKVANIADANFHCLRHSFASRCIEAGVDIKSLSEMLGHANVNITLNRYVHSSFEQKREGMNKLENFTGI